MRATMTGRVRRRFAASRTVGTGAAVAGGGAAGRTGASTSIV